MNIFPAPFNVFINYMFNIILIIYTFKLSVLKSIFATFSSAIIFGLIGSLLSNPYLALLNISSDEVVSVPIYRIGFLIIMYIFLYLIILIIKHRHFHLNLFEDMDFKTKFSILANIILGLLSLITQAIIISFYIDVLPLWITFLSFVSLLAYFII